MHKHMPTFSSFSGLLAQRWLCEAFLPQNLKHTHLWLWIQLINVVSWRFRVGYLKPKANEMSQAVDRHVTKRGSNLFRKFAITFLGLHVER
jgi:hypothetical protein